MLERLALNNVGPAPEMALDFRPRVNLITGDNGLGKSFLLDVAWWALTRRWPREVNRRMTSGFPARPHDPEREASITFRVRGKTVTTSYTATFSKPDQAWIGGPGRPAIPGLVVYAHADGSFSVWDPARNYWTQPVNSDVPERRPAYVFTEEEVWDGLRDDVNGRSVPVCNGLLYDWSTWIQAHDDNARGMASALLALSPSQEPNEAITPGPPMRLSVDDARDIPTIETGYAGSVPILHASSGVRRAVALAYMLTWTWSEHKVTARMRGEEPSAQIVMLFDEVESHLHPHWQRSILDALRSLGSVLLDDGQLQLVVSTHSPLVMASAEPWFDPQQDAWFDLDLQGDPPRMQLRHPVYTPHGTTGAWLTSEAFGLATDRSWDAEQAILHARQLLLQSEPPLEDIMAVHDKLAGTLPDIDPFRVRWNAFVESRGGTP